MSDYISREAAIQTACVGCQYNFPDLPCSATDCVIKGRVVNIPAADVAPVVHGRWKKCGKYLYECQNCGEIYSTKDNLGKGWYFCPCCMAMTDMDAEVEE